MTGNTGLAVSRDGSSNGTTPKSFRLALGGLLSKQTTGIDVRKGIMWDGGGAVVTGTAGMAYSVRACVAVVMPTTTQGPVVAANDGAVSVATTAAPGSNSRIDSIWVRQHLVAADGGADTDVTLEFGVTQGATAASPVAPSIPTGAVEIAQAVVTALATVTSGLTITQTHNWCAAAGAPIPVRSNTERALLTAYDGLVVNNLTSKRLEKYNGTAWESIVSSDSGWVAVPGNGTFTSTAQVRKEGTRVTMRGYFARPTSFSAALVSAGTIPAGYRPSVDHYFALGQPTTAIGVRAVVAATGDVQIGMNAASTNGMGAATVWYTD